MKLISKHEFGVIENSKKSFPLKALESELALALVTLYRSLTADAESPEPLPIPVDVILAFSTCPVEYGLAEIEEPVIGLVKIDCAKLIPLEKSRTESNK